jgi:hypothetical protein
VIGMYRYGANLFVGVLLMTTLAVQRVEGRPVPVGESLITISYDSSSGLQTFSGLRGYMGSGPTDATVFPGAPNIAAFNSAQTFGRRLAVAQNPAFSAVMQPGETLMSHAFFKRLDNLAGDYFPGIPQDGTITVKVENILFDRPVTVDQDTLLLHMLWRSEQSDQLTPPHHHLHNIHTRTADFRDTDLFMGAGEFANLPSPNFVLGDERIDWLISGNGTVGSPLTIMATFPYDVMRNLEEEHHHPTVPGGLPAPHGFLEPWHFHIEYTVVPEPTTLAFMLVGGYVLLRRRGQGC